MEFPALGAWAAVGAVGAAIALHTGDPTSAHLVGARQTLPGAGATVAAYTVTALTPSADSVPVRARLYQATLTVEAQRGAVTPMVGCFNARATGGQTYPALDATTAQGLSRDTVPPGARSIGRIYFDVTGPAPDSVVCNNGMSDLLVWQDTAPTTADPAPPEPAPDTETISI